MEKKSGISLPLETRSIEMESDPIAQPWVGTGRLPVLIEKFDIKIVLWDIGRHWFFTKEDLLKVIKRVGLCMNIE